MMDRRLGLWLALACLGSSALAAAAMNSADQAGYALGYSMGKSLAEQKVPIPEKALIQGIQDGILNHSPAIKEADMNQALDSLRGQMIAKLKSDLEAKKQTNQAEQKKFLASNRKNPGVVTLPSGLQYKIDSKGSGPIPNATDTVQVYYSGQLLDGTQFDANLNTDNHDPVEFPVNQVIPGWSEALQLMPVGSKWTLYVPSDLAYGETGVGSVIGPDQSLVFKIELVGITTPDSSKQDADTVPVIEEESIAPDGTVTVLEEEVPVSS